MTYLWANYGINPSADTSCHHAKLFDLKSTEHFYEAIKKFSFDLVSFYEIMVFADVPSTNWRENAQIYSLFTFLLQFVSIYRESKLVNKKNYSRIMAHSKYLHSRFSLNMLTYLFRPWVCEHSFRDLWLLVLLFYTKWCFMENLFLK